MLPLQSAIGLFALVGLAWLVRDRARTVIWRPVVVGIGLTFLLAVLLLKVPFLRDSLSVWKEAGWGFALWNLRGSFGVLDSGREDVKYENFRGMKLDREMLELLRRY